MSSGGALQLDQDRRNASARDRRAWRTQPRSPSAGGLPSAGGPGEGILLSGATGFLGMELLARFLERGDRRVYALVRAASEQEAGARVEAALRLLFGAGHPYSGCVIAVRGDLTRAGLGMRERRRDWLAARVGEIVHAGASVSFADRLGAARAVNLGGTLRMLEFADHCQERAGLRRFTYVSTAYVAGDQAGCFSEDELDVGQGFRNAYEHSKYEAEQLVRGWRSQLPVTIVRPSIIVGERASGWTCSFNVLYWPLRAFSRGAYVAVPGRADAPVDVVPVDYVADALIALSQAPEAAGATFHLTAGRHASCVGELVELASGYFGRPAPRLIEPRMYRRVIHPLLLRAARDEHHRRALRRSELFFPYFAANPRYDERRTRAVLHGSGIEPSPLRDYFDRLVEFALAADWGRSRPSRPGVPVPRWSARRTARRPPVANQPVPAG
jgi:thioester reductase-like protein